jgi:hypothetical protein
LSGTGWVETGGNQYRNNGGNDGSCTFAHYISTSASTATGNVSKNQVDVAPDLGTSSIITFYEYAPPVGGANRDLTLLGVGS